MVNIKDSQTLRERLRTFGAVERPTVLLVDEYFDYPGWKLKTVGKRLRLRREVRDLERAFKVSYKGPRLRESNQWY